MNRLENAISDCIELQDNVLNIALFDTYEQWKKECFRIVERSFPEIKTVVLFVFFQNVLVTRYNEIDFIIDKDRFMED